MKKIILTLVVISVAYFAQAQQIQQSEVPEKVKKEFAEKNPNATIMSWEKADKNYKAIYSIDNNETTALYNPSGKLIEQVFTVSHDDLPSNITEYLSGAEEKQTISNIYIVKDASANKSYKVKINGMYYFFDSLGNFTKKIKS